MGACVVSAHHNAFHHNCLAIVIRGFALLCNPVLQRPSPSGLRGYCIALLALPDYTIQPGELHHAPSIPAPPLTQPAATYDAVAAISLVSGHPSHFAPSIPKGRNANGQPFEDSASPAARIGQPITPGGGVCRHPHEEAAPQSSPHVASGAVVSSLMPASSSLIRWPPDWLRFAALARRGETRCVAMVALGVQGRFWAGSLDCPRHVTVTWHIFIVCRGPHCMRHLAQPGYPDVR